LFFELAPSSLPGSGSGITHGLPAAR
jgi:hypothetical protein